MGKRRKGQAPPAACGGVDLRKAACGFLRIMKGVVMKDKMSVVYNYIVKHCKIVFPIVLIAVVAVTVAIALGAKNGEEEEPKEASEASQAAAGTEENEPLAVAEEIQEIPLVPNEEGELYTLVATYYNAMALGDTETLLGIYDELPENSVLKIEETAKYIDYYPALEIYTKEGLEEGSTVVYVYYRLLFKNQEDEFPGYETLYVCRDEQGELYIKNEDNFTEEENEYIKTVTKQDDVVEFNNRVNTEYNDLISEKPELLRYLSELDNQISVAVGVRVAQQNTEAENAAASENQEQSAEEGSGNQEQPAEAVPEETGPQYATATTTVNVRSSDSEQADKLGKVAGGESVQVQEVRVNGWTKIVYDGQDGYIKSEYLQLQESAAGAETIGTVTAATNINVRASASETADRLGVLAGGESVDLIENADGWCKIKYNGQIGYVKADYVQQ